MNRRLVSVAVLGLAGLVGSSALAAAPTAYPRPGRTDPVSVGVGGAPARYPVTSQLRCDSAKLDMTPDGRYVVFDSSASNLVPNDTNASCDVFRLDRTTGNIARVSTAADGSQALAGPGTTAGSRTPSVSSDGRYVAFVSNAPNLIPGNTNHCAVTGGTYCYDIYVKDMVRGGIVRASVSATGAQGRSGSLGGLVAIGADSFAPSISGDGQRVLFLSSAV